MRLIVLKIVLKKHYIIKNIQNKLFSDEFIVRHKYNNSDFTRNRKLSFIDIFMLILKNSVKSLQMRLNEYMLQSKLDYTITNSAFTQARKKFCYTAFQELNDDTVSTYYQKGGYKTLFGFRCIAADCSTIILPKYKEIIEEFGLTKIKNQHIEDTYVSAKCECYYDVLNKIVIKTQLADHLSYEVNLALNMIDDFTEQDLLIYDRGYASYKMMATLIKNNKNFLIRIPKSSFKESNKFFNNNNKYDSKIVTLNITEDCQKDLNLPIKINVRLIKLQLSTGETEILATSLMDRKITINDFSSLYQLRWGVETFFSIIKGRLNLEHFTGKTLESIKQDFWSTIFISNIETVMTENVEATLNINNIEQNFTKQVNKAVSFNAIKNLAFDIFFNEKNQDMVAKKLEQLFLQNPTLKRPNRIVERRKISARNSLNFQLRMKKHIF